MDLNKPMDFPFSACPSPQQHNSMSMESFELPNQQQPNKYAEADALLAQERSKNLELFWNQQLMEIYHTSVSKSNHQLPLARIKRIMKADGEVKMVSAETPVIFSKACELFVLELTLRAWLQTEERKRRTVRSCDIAMAIRQDNLFDFLVNVVPSDHDHYYKRAGAGKDSEQTQSHPAESLHHPMTINSGESVRTNPEVLGLYMIDQLASCAEHEYDSPPK